MSLKLWELDKEKKYHSICGTIESDEYGWYVSINSDGECTEKKELDRHVCVKYNWTDIEKMIFREVLPDAEKKKLYAYKHNRGEIVFSVVKDEWISDFGANNKEVGKYYRAPEYDMEF